MIGEDWNDGGGRGSKRGRSRGRGHFRGRRGWHNHRTWQRTSEGSEAEKSSEVKEQNIDEQVSPSTSEEKSASRMFSETSESGFKNAAINSNCQLEEEKDKTCESLVGAILADVAVQQSDTMLNMENTKETVVDEVRSGLGDLDQVNGEVQEVSGVCDGKEVKKVDSRRCGRGGKKRIREEWKGRREAKRRKKDQVVVSLQEVPTRKPTLLEKVCKQGEGEVGTAY